MHQGWALATRDAGVRKGGVSGRVVADLTGAIAVRAVIGVQCRR